jgi:hypothetical protein
MTHILLINKLQIFIKNKINDYLLYFPNGLLKPYALHNLTGGSKKTGKKGSCAYLDMEES